MAPATESLSTVILVKKATGVAWKFGVAEVLRDKLGMSANTANVGTLLIKSTSEVWHVGGYKIET